MKNTMLNNGSGLTTLTINDDQANTLIDLVSDQIRRTRVYLRTTPLNKTNISALAHFRNLKRLLLAKEKEIQRQEDIQEAEAIEARQMYDFMMSL